MALGRAMSDPARWTVPQGTTIGPGEHMIVWCDSSRSASVSAGPDLNTGFALDDHDGEVHLFNSAGQVVDSVNYGRQLPDQSIGRLAGEWKLLEWPTPGSTNAVAAVLGLVSAVRINEWLALPETGADWFELYNTGPLPVDLGGSYLTDDPSVDSRTQYLVRPLTFIGRFNWVTWRADNTSPGDHRNTGFALDQLGETLRLYDSGLQLVDGVDFGVQTRGVSEGRAPDGGTEVTALSTPTPGSGNELAHDGIGLLEPRVNETGQFVMELIGSPNHGYVIEVSSDLVDWTVVGAVYPSAETTLLTLPWGDSEVPQFYRARFE
jgi:hypothetical protein